MTSRPFYSHFQVPEIPMPVIGAQIGVSMDLDNVNKVDVRRAVNGAALVVQSPFPRKVKISVSATGKAIQGEPAWAALSLGAPCTVYSLKSVTAYILPGQTSCVVDHDIVPGSTIVRDDKDVATFAGRTISIGAAKAYVVCVRWRPVYYCVLAGHSGSANEVEGSQTWRGEFEER